MHFVFNKIHCDVVIYCITRKDIKKNDWCHWEPWEASDAFIQFNSKEKKDNIKHTLNHTNYIAHKII